MHIKELLSKKFPTENAICVLTRFTENIKRFTMAWKINAVHAKKYDKIIIIDISKKHRGKYIIADIDYIISLSEIKKKFKNNELSEILNEVIDKDKHDFDNNSTFSDKNMSINNDVDSRFVIILKKETLIKGQLEDNFKATANPVFYIDKHFTQKQLENLKISNFLHLNNINIKFAKGINLFIGENNVGKTGLLKFLYANIKSYEEYNKLKNTSSERTFKELLSIKLQNTFQSGDKIGSIVCKYNNKDLKSKLTIDNYNFEFSFKKTTQFEVSDLKFPEISKQNLLSNRFNTVFIPAKEVLSISEIIKLVKNRYSMSGFDDTYSDLVKDIEPLFIKKNENSTLDKISNEFNKNIIEGEIEYDSEIKKYYYQGADGYKYDLTMTAEGVKQLGIIPLLIKTGKIKKGTILFLDEPDNNLNPVAIRKFVYALLDIANAGVQIFITTHNHLLSQYISLLNEYKSVYKTGKIPESRFFALYKEKNNKISIEKGNDLLDISNNLILDEYIILHDKEQELIFKSENI